MNNFLFPFFSQENTSSKTVLHTILCFISLNLASLYTDSPLNLVFCKQDMSSDICSSIWAGFLNQCVSAPTFTLDAVKCTNFLFRLCSDNVTLLLSYMASSLWKVPILLIEMWQNFQRSCNWCSGKTSYKLLETDLLLVKSLKSAYLIKENTGGNKYKRCQELPLVTFAEKILFHASLLWYLWMVLVVTNM